MKISLYNFYIYHSKSPNSYISQFKALLFYSKNPLTLSFFLKSFFFASIPRAISYDYYIKNQYCSKSLFDYSISNSHCDFLYVDGCPKNIPKHVINHILSIQNTSTILFVVNEKLFSHSTIRRFFDCSQDLLSIDCSESINRLTPYTLFPNLECFDLSQDLWQDIYYSSQDYGLGFVFLETHKVCMYCVNKQVNFSDLNECLFYMADNKDLNKFFELLLLGDKFDISLHIPKGYSPYSFFRLFSIYLSKIIRIFDSQVLHESSGFLDLGYMDFVKKNINVIDIKLVNRMLILSVNVQNAYINSYFQSDCDYLDFFLFKCLYGY